MVAIVKELKVGNVIGILGSAFARRGLLVELVISAEMAAGVLGVVVVNHVSVTEMGALIEFVIRLISVHYEFHISCCLSPR